MNDMFPTLISRICNPIVVLTVFFPILLFRNGIVGWDLAAHMVVFLTVVVLPPACALLWAVRTKRVTNWDLSNRKQRIRALVWFVPFLLLDGCVLVLSGSAAAMQGFLYFLVLFFGLFLITLWFKLSVHMMTITTTVLFFLHWYGWMAAFSLLIIPLVGWSRVKLKRHTASEVIAGVSYACVIFFLARELHLI